MQYCTACQKAIATIVVMDVNGDYSVTGSQHVCAECAQQLGVAPTAPLKMPGALLEDLLESFSSKTSPAPAPAEAPEPIPGREPSHVEACPGCGMLPADFRSKGRLGCPRCYISFRADLMPLLQRIHESQSHIGRLPSTMSKAPEPAEQQDLSELRQDLEDAVRGERYEEAAQLRDQLRRAELGETTEGDENG